MNIAVVTVYDGVNCGSYLQAYAMKHYLESRGHTVCFVRRQTEEENFRMFWNGIPTPGRGPVYRFLQKVKRKVIRNRKKDAYFVREYAMFRTAWREFSCVSPQALEGIDLLLCGSDELWNKRNPMLDVPFYLCRGYGDGLRKAAVSISTGHARTEDFDGDAETAELMREFDVILARDTGTQRIVSHCTGQIPEKICDPTLMVDKSVLVRPECAPQIRDPYLFVYAYRLSPAQKDILLAYARQHGLRIVTTCNYQDFADEVVVASPLAFGTLIAHAQACFTSTFHGAIFCGLFARHFCCCSALPKVREVMADMGTEAFLWDGENAGKFDEIMAAELPRCVIEHRLAEMRKRADSLLRETVFCEDKVQNKG